MSDGTSNVGTSVEHVRIDFRLGGIAPRKHLLLGISYTSSISGDRLKSTCIGPASARTPVYAASRIM